MSKILIIGNGFDLNLGLKTSYNHFIKCEQFQELITQENNLAEYLQTIQGSQNWVDIEHQLKKYTLILHEYISASHRNFIFTQDQTEQLNKKKKCLELLNYEFVALKKALAEYLGLQFENITSVSSLINTCAYEVAIRGRLLPSKKTNQNPFTELFTFNYTNALKLINFRQHLENCQIHHIHGDLDNQNIVFGVEDGAVSPEHSYLNKSDHAAFGNAPDVSAAIIQAKEVHFFGCSLGDTDDAHFLRAFDEISTNRSYDMKDEDKRKIFFYVYGKQSYRNIYNRIMALTNSRISEFKLINKVTFYDLATNKEIDQEWLNQ